MNWTILSSGLALLAFALLVLARLRWTQSRPISTCVVLSVFAHILLIVSAYRMNLFETPLGPPGDETFCVTLVMEGSTPPGHDPHVAAVRQPSATIDRAETSPEIHLDVWPTVQPVPNESVNRQADDQSDERPEPPDPLEPIGLQPVDSVASPEPQTAVTEPTPEPTRTEETTAEDTTEKKGTTVPVEEHPTNSTPRDHAELEPQRLAEQPTTAEPVHAVSAMRDQPTASDPETTEASEPPTAEAPALADGSRLSPPDAANGNHSDDSSWNAFPLVNVDSPPVERRLTNGQPLPKAYWLRVVPDRLGVVQRRGGNQQTEQAVNDALQWLASHQSPDGRWDARATGAVREDRVAGHDRGHAGLGADTGITGLALLAFQGAGHTHLDGPHRQVVQQGLEYLLRTQRSDGNLAGAAGRYAMMYCHGIATLAVCEAYAMTGDARLEPFARRAVNYIIYAQHHTTGGWRYGPGEPGDTSQLGWQLMALTTAQLGGIPIPARTQTGMDLFLRSVSSGKSGGLAAYRPSERGRPSPTMTAEAMVCRLFLHGTRDQAALNEGADYVLAHLPGNGRANLYYWYYATLGMSQLDEPQWRRWNAALVEQLLPAQRADGDHSGSWDPDTMWGGYGGRVYSTALAALCLEVYYRYIPMAGASVLNPQRGSVVQNSIFAAQSP
jgi:hypothetical protein